MQDLKQKVLENLKTKGYHEHQLKELNTIIQATIEATKQALNILRVSNNEVVVCKGENDIECRIGDKVQISEPPERVFHRQRDATRIGERTYYEGVLKLSLENGYYLEGDGIHFQPPKHGTPSKMGGRELWIWRRLD